MTTVTVQGDGVPLQNTAPIPALSSAQPGNPLHGIHTSPVSLNPIVIDSQGHAGTGIASLPQQTFCFPSCFSNSNISPGVSLPTSTVTSPAPQLSALPVGSVFNLNPRIMNPQFMHPITIPQQQTLKLPINQQNQSQQPQPNIPVAHQSITIAQSPGLGGSSTSTIPLNQVVGSAIGTPSLNFVNPTILTMPQNPTTGQPQFLPQPFSQIPIVIGGHQLTSSINALTTQATSISVISQPATVLSSTPSSAAVALTAPSTVTGLVQATATLSPIVAQDQSSKLTDTTLSPEVIEGSQSCSSTSAPNSTLSSTAGHTVTSLAASALSGNLVSSLEGPLMKTNAVSKSKNGCARMKFTPINPDRDVDPRFHQSKALLENKTDDEDEYEEDEEQASNSSGQVDIDERGSPISPSTDIKLEPYDESERNTPDDDDGDKQSLSPSEGVEGLQKSDTQGDVADVEDLEEAEFVWDDYLKETGASSVPPTAFKHVELSLQSGFVKGMKLEAPNKHSPNTYWVATVVMTCGPLLRLRYEGYKDNSSADFWSDPMTSDIHPVGWCDRNGKIMKPPSVIQEKYSDWNELLQNALENAALAPSYLLDKSTGATPVDQIQEGMRLEIQSTSHPHHLWLVKILENVGGRLCLRYHGLEGGSHDCWLFYLDDRLHPVGWCKENGYHFAPPEVVKTSSDKSEESLIQDVETTITESQDLRSLAAIFKDQGVIEPHGFEVGMKLEAVDPVNLANICPATVSELVDKNYFFVEIDGVITSESAAKKTRFYCHQNSHNIFPINWASRNGIKLTTPFGWGEKDFSWKEYMETSKSVSAPESLFDLESLGHEFECGMKLEVVNPRQASQICAATITKVAGPLLWVHLDSSRKVMDSHVESLHSFNLFPISWCVSNGYQLQPPKRSFTAASRKRIAVVQPERSDESKGSQPVQSQGGTSDRELFGGPQVYFNHRCFSGPFLSKGRIAELPRSVGPGPVTLVMKEVMSKLIQTAYKSSRVLRELQLEGRPGPGMTMQMLKAKYKGKSYRAQVEICRGASQLEEFCRNMCIKLQCCPNLVSPHHITGNCPENCSQLTKTKYTYYYGKRKKKIGRPPGGHTNLENGQKKPGKRKKRQKIGMINNSLQTNVDEQPDNDDDKASVCSDTKTIDSISTTGSKERADISSKNSIKDNSNFLKRRYTHHIPPPSEIQTRGAKLPKYSFEKRTHKKIMIVEGEQRTNSVKKEASQSSRLYHENYDTKDGSTFSPIRPENLPMMLKSEPPLKLEKNPLEWTVGEVGEFLMTTDCKDRDLLQRLKIEEIDGQALLLLTLPNVQEYMGIKLGPAIKLCHLIERIKLAFYEDFAK